MSRAILLIEPDLERIEMLSAQLRSRGLDVVLADGAESALDRGHRRVVEAILVSEGTGNTREIVTRLESDTKLGSLPRYILVARVAAPDELPLRDPDAIARALLKLPSKPPVAAEAGDFRGDLAQVSLSDLLQLLNMNRRTGTLSVTTPSGGGELQLVDGQAVDASFRRLQGRKALIRLLAIRDGSFAFTTGPAAPMRVLEDPMRMLLLDGLREVDEVRRRRVELAVDDDALVAQGPTSAVLPGAERKVHAALQFPRILDELLDEAAQDDLTILGAVSRMLADGSIRRVPRGAERVAVFSGESNWVGAMLRRRRRRGFAGPPRILIVAQAADLERSRAAIGRLAEATLPGEPAPAGMPEALVTLRFGEGGDLVLVGIADDRRFAPLWPLTLAGSLMLLTWGAENEALWVDLAQSQGITHHRVEDLAPSLEPGDARQWAAALHAAIGATHEQ